MMLGIRPMLWRKEKRTDTEVVLRMTSSTGLTVKFLVRFLADHRDFTVSWGDGTQQTCAYASVNQFVSHTYSDYGTYVAQFWNVKGLGFRYLDYQSQYVYDAAPISIVDYSGLYTEIPSGSFKSCVNIERVILPASTWVGQRPFANCTSLKEVKLGPCDIHYDGSFQNCSSLESFEAEACGICWSYVWQGCTKIKELKLGKIEQFATQDFQNTPNLMDIWISDKTVDQIRQVAASGNIVSGYGAAFPWSANSACRFHGTDGIVLGDGTVIRD